jgi:hypothetical protein
VQRMLAPARSDRAENHLGSGLSSGRD